jgi:hypothetical protein
VLATDSIVSNTCQSKKFVITRVLAIKLKASKADKVLTVFTRFPLCFWHLAVLNSLSSVDIRTFSTNLQFVIAVALMTDIATRFVPVDDALRFSVGAGTKNALKDHYVEKFMLFVRQLLYLWFVQTCLYLYIYVYIYLRYFFALVFQDYLCRPDMYVI